MTREHALKLLRPFGLDKVGVKNAFRRAAMKYHPDRGGSAQAFRRICEAREVLEGHGESQESWRERPPRPYGFGAPFEEHMRAYQTIFNPDPANMADQIDAMLKAWANVFNDKEDGE